MSLSVFRINFNGSLKTVDGLIVPFEAFEHWTEFNMSVCIVGVDRNRWLNAANRFLVSADATERRTESDTSSCIFRVEFYGRHEALDGLIMLASVVKRYAKIAVGLCIFGVCFGNFSVAFHLLFLFLCTLMFPSFINMLFGSCLSCICKSHFGDWFSVGANGVGFELQIDCFCRWTATLRTHCFSINQ